jgi:uncharacterized membrane protein
MIAGLVVFLGVHSTRIVADDWRAERVAVMGERRWKLVYSIVSLVGLVLIIYGYGQARQATSVLYAPPAWGRHATALLTLAAFILIPASHIPGTRIRAFVRHPMVLGVILWAIGHLLANGTVADVVLFGAVLAWAIVDYASSLARDRRASVAYPVGPVSRDVKAIDAGTVVWFVFGYWLHGPLIGRTAFGA